MGLRLGMVKNGLTKGIGGVDLKGHIPYVKYQINKNFTFKVQYAMGQEGIDDGSDRDTLKLDLACKF